MASQTGKRPAARTTIAVQGARVHNLKNISRRDPARSPGRRDGPVGIGQVEPGVRHHLRRGTAALHGVAFELRQALRLSGGQARCGLRLRPVARDLDRAEDAHEQPAFDRRHDDRHRQLPEPALRHHWPAALPAHGRAHAEPIGEPDSRGLLSLPKGAEVELRAPVFRIYGEELDVVFTEVRKKGCRCMIIDGKRIDISDQVDVDESRVREMDAVVDRFVDRPDATRRRSRPASRPRCSSAMACCRSP